MNAIIITIGDELLMGKTIDTNSSWVASELIKFGFKVTYKVSVPDSKKAILNFEPQFHLHII